MFDTWMLTILMAVAGAALLIVIVLAGGASMHRVVWKSFRCPLQPRHVTVGFLTDRSQRDRYSDVLSCSAFDAPWLVCCDKRCLKLPEAYQSPPAHRAGAVPEHPCHGPPAARAIVCQTCAPSATALTVTRRVGAALTGVILLVGLVGCTAPLAQGPTGRASSQPIPPASSAEALAAGHRLAQQHCTGCHTEGNPDGTVALMDRTGQSWTGHAWHHPDSILAQMIADGVSRPTGTMPPFGAELHPDEIRTLIAFIKTFWTPEQRQFQRERTQRADGDAPRQ